MKRLLVYLVAALSLALMADGDSFSVWSYPSVSPQHNRLRMLMVEAVKRGNIKDFEQICRAGVKLMPTDATWHYNLACALAYRATPDEALKELSTAVKLGFRDAKAIQADRDLERIKDDKRFKDLVEEARVTASLPVAGKPMFEELRLTAGRSATVKESNVVWNFDRNVFVCPLKFTFPQNEPITLLARKYAGPGSAYVTAWLSEGTACGNGGDIYINNDHAHSRINVNEFPLLSELKFCEAAEKAGINYELPKVAVPDHAVIGNASLARTGLFGRSLPRCALTDQNMFAVMSELYLDNQFWAFPANKDYGMQLGDVFNASSPIFLVSEGISWSDRPFVREALAASAAMPRPTKKYLIENRLFASTMQWLFRSSRKGVSSDADYLTPKAQNMVFAKDEIDESRLLEKAHRLLPAAVPPVVILNLVQSKIAPVRHPQPVVDYPDMMPELVYHSPVGWGFVLRDPEKIRTFLVQAKASPMKVEKGVEYEWRVIHGNAEAVKIVPPTGELMMNPKNGIAQIELDQSMFTGRVDVAVFAKSEKTSYGAPSVLSFWIPPMITRTYDDKGRIVTVDYTNKNKIYSDPVLGVYRAWVDTYKYDDNGNPLGYVRSFNGVDRDSFTPKGEKILERDASGKPTKVIGVSYVPRATGVPNIPPELTYVDSGEPYEVK